ncbi:PrgH/EprH family type III secretion apparatus protein [Citrobacter sp. Igbk 16]|uniref:PrgH/EprH family type III secretion apparatus protein n=1 Tax=Citrobacter sp. Igbk 16 TaxID=2963958 RepID=UPI0023036B4A|nr:PrgH/EprH family type III secretion apparatus protein [Citrobacter sp. Igbk 16]MDA8519056.1 type III secretion apparatus [Citrobacter sp. Igbk 16]
MEENSQHAGMDCLPHYVMKVLSGSMYGVDIPLPHSENVHVRFMSQEQLLTAEQSEQQSIFSSINTVVVPAPAEQSTCFLLSLITSTESDTEAVSYQLLSLAGEDFLSPENGGETSDRVLSLNSPVKIGLITIALKIKGEPWSQDVVNYSRGPFSALHQDESITDTSVTKVSTDKSYLRRQLYWLIFLSTVILVVAAASFIVYYAKVDNSASVLSLLSPVEPDIVKLKDGSIYVIVKNDTDAGWGWQELNKSNINTEKIHIVSLESARLELSAKLHELKIPFHKIELADSSTLTIMFSTERCTTNTCNKSFNALISKNYPWIKNTVIGSFADQEIIASAKRKFSELGFQFTTNITPFRASFMIHGVIEREQYTVIQNSIDNFRQKYGSEYVQFDFGLEEPGLRPLTYRNGDDSYAIISDYHWLYPY